MARFMEPPSLAVRIRGERYSKSVPRATKPCSTIFANKPIAQTAVVLKETCYTMPGLSFTAQPLAAVLMAGVWSTKSLREEMRGQEEMPGAPRFAPFETWDSTDARIVGTQLNQLRPL